MMTMSKSKATGLKPGQRAPESGQYGIVGPRGGNTGVLAARSRHPIRISASA
jgi:hypothetical protein